MPVTNYPGDGSAPAPHHKTHEAGGSDEVAGGAVDSVNGEVGVVVLDYTDVGAAPLNHAHSIAEVIGLQPTLDRMDSKSGKLILDRDGEFSAVNELAEPDSKIEVSTVKGTSDYPYPDGTFEVVNQGNTQIDLDDGSHIMPDDIVITEALLPTKFKVTPATNRNAFIIADIPTGETALGAIEQNIETKELRAVLGDAKTAGSGLAFDDPTGVGFAHTNSSANGVYVHPQVFNETLGVVVIKGISSFYTDYLSFFDTLVRFGLYKMTNNDTLPDDSSGFPVPDAYTEWIALPKYSQYKRDVLNNTEHLFDNEIELAAGEGYCFLVETNKSISYYSDSTTTTVNINGTNYYDCGFGANDFGMKVDSGGGGKWNGSSWTRNTYKTMGAVITYAFPLPSYPAEIVNYTQITKLGTTDNPLSSDNSTKAILVTKDQMDGVVAMPTFAADEFPFGLVFENLQHQPLPRIETTEPADPPEGCGVFWMDSSGNVIIKKTVSGSTTDTTIA